MNTAVTATGPLPEAFPRSVWPRVAWVVLAIYVVYACAQMDISWERLQTGLANAARFFAVGQIEIVITPFFIAWIIGYRVAVAARFHGRMELN